MWVVCEAIDRSLSITSRTICGLGSSEYFVLDMGSSYFVEGKNPHVRETLLTLRDLTHVLEDAGQEVTRQGGRGSR